MDWDAMPLDELLAQIREDFRAAMYNEAKCLSGSHHRSPSPLELMVQAFDGLVVLVPALDARRRAMSLPEGARTALLWIQGGADGACRAQEVRFERFSRWPNGNDYSGPTMYLREEAPERAYDVAPGAAARVEALAKDGRLALVVLDGTCILAAY